MEQWFSVDLGDGVEANGPSGRIQEAFFPVFASAGSPMDMAIFSRYDLERNIVTAYFSPRAVDVARAFGATPCNKPQMMDGLALLVGDQRCMKHFYPEAG